MMEVFVYLDGITSLPLDMNMRGILEWSAEGVVQVGEHHRAFPFEQPQPYYIDELSEGGPTTRTTDGVALLGQVLGGGHHTEPLLVRAGYNLLCALLITPKGLALRDVAAMQVNRHNNGVVFVIKPPEVFSASTNVRFGLPENSSISFSSNYNGKIKVGPGYQVEDELPSKAYGY